MNRLIKRLVYLIILPVMAGILINSGSVHGQEQTDDIVYTEAELREWYKAHRNTGGEVFLGDSVILSNYLGSIYDLGEITINTGEYGLIFEAGFTTENIIIIGEGVDTPVIEIRQAEARYAHWNLLLQDIRVTATGRDGQGGIAVYVTNPANWPFAITSFTNRGSIQSYGENAVGLYLTDSLQLYCADVYVEGTGSTAVYSEQTIDIYYSRLNASGRNATAASGGGISLIGCQAEPVADDVFVQSVSIRDIKGRVFYHPIALNSLHPGYFDSRYQFLMESDDGTLSYYEEFDVNWSPHHDAWDSGGLGSYTVSGNLAPSFQDLGLEAEFPLEMLVEVRDPDKPCIQYLHFTEWQGRECARMHFWHNHDPLDENVILWRSDDDGETWYDFTDSAQLEWRDRELTFYYEDITNPILLQIEVVGVGESNLAVISRQNSRVRGELRGDRTGTDRNKPTVDDNDDDGNIKKNPRNNPIDTIDSFDPIPDQMDSPGEDASPGASASTPVLPGSKSKNKPDISGVISPFRKPGNAAPFQSRDADTPSEQGQSASGKIASERSQGNSRLTAPAAMQSIISGTVRSPLAPPNEQPTALSGSAPAATAATQPVRRIKRSEVIPPTVPGMMASAGCTLIFLLGYLGLKRKGR